MVDLGGMIMDNQSQTQPVVSVIMPVYNARNYLNEALDSLTNKTMQNIEIICIDDHSSDGCWDILNERSRKDSRIMVIRNEENRGAYYSRNRGLEVARGEYIYFMDADDWLDEETFSICVQHMERDDLDILYFAMEAFFENEDLENRFNFHYQRYGSYSGVYRGQEIFEKFSQNDDHRVQLPGAFFRHRFLKNEGILFNEYTNNMDDLFYFQTLVLAERVQCIPNIFYHRRWREGSLMTVGTGPKNLLARLIIYCEIQKFLCSRRCSISEMFIFYTYANRYYRTGVELCAKLIAGANKNLDLLDWEFEDPVYNAVFQQIVYVAQRYGTKTSGIFDHFFPYHLFSPGEKVVIYGAGNIGCQFYRQVKRWGDIELVGIVDANSSAKFPRDIPVTSLKSLKNMNFDSVLISIHDYDIARKVKEKLVEMGIQEDCIKWDGRIYYQDEYWPDFVNKLRCVQEKRFV